ncbi:MAG: hypothetical protein IKG11_02045 [Atopobiaceae bacterium]|nr:hypothetical protein [Atopobiaceae bacterium]MDO4405234.1 hypothetical protein [Atopobiaceae bacterium]
MGMKERMDALMAGVPEDKRGELARKLLEAATIEERIAIAKTYLAASALAENAPEWLSDSYELTDEDLVSIAAGADMPWDNEIDEYGCY